MKILIADDHQLLADALSQLVRENEADAQVVQASSLDDAMDAMAREEKVEIVLLDYDLPGMDGIQGLMRFRGKYPDTPCAVFAGQSGTGAASDVLAHGAAGFIPKDLSAPAFFHAIKLIQVGERFIPSSLYDDMASRSMAAAQDLQTAAEFVQATGLSRREVDVLRALVQGISNRQIGEELGVEEVTVKLHLRRIYKKIGVSNRTRAVKLALAKGIS